MNSKACHKRERHRNQSLPRVRHTALDRLHSNGTILRDDRAVEAPVESYTQPAFAARNQGFGIRPRHARQVVNVHAALTTETHAIVAQHLVPTNFAGGRPLQSWLGPN